MLANTFGCSVGTLPFAYLGFPLGTTQPNKKAKESRFCITQKGKKQTQ
jgi:hypothetical protein